MAIDGRRPWRWGRRWIDLCAIGATDRIPNDTAKVYANCGKPKEMKHIRKNLEIFIVFKSVPPSAYYKHHIELLLLLFWLFACRRFFTFG
jgi:hypothetical protein